MKREREWKPPPDGKITVGQIWLVIEEMKADGREHVTCESCGHTHLENTSIMIPKGTFIEIRYPYAWHFRTVENKYLHSEPEDIINSAKLFGVLHKKVGWENRKTLAEILAEGLYDLQPLTKEKS